MMKKARSCFYLLFLMTFCLDFLLAQELNIGLPEHEKSSNILSDNDPFASLIRSASTESLLRNDLNGQLKLVLADSFSYSADRKSMELRLKQASMFSNGQLIAETDILSSFSFCQRRIGKAASSFSFNAMTKNERLYLRVSQLPEKTDSLPQEKSISLEDFILQCPLISAKSLEVFGSKAGEYNLIVATGPYMLVNRVKNREARLERVSSAGGWAKTVNIRSLRSSEQGLSALRIGTLDLFYTQDHQILQNASNDQTLRIEDCGVYKVILRKSLQFSCKNQKGQLIQPEPGKIRYFTE